MPAELRAENRGWTPGADPGDARDALAPQLSLSKLASPSSSEIEAKDEGNHRSRQVNRSSETSHVCVGFSGQKKFLFIPPAIVVTTTAEVQSTRCAKPSINIPGDDQVGCGCGKRCASTAPDPLRPRGEPRTHPFGVQVPRSRRRRRGRSGKRLQVRSAVPATGKRARTTSFVDLLSNLHLWILGD